MTSDQLKILRQLYLSQAMIHRDSMKRTVLDLINEALTLREALQHYAKNGGAIARLALGEEDEKTP